MPALTSPLLLYIVPMWGPDKLRNVWNLDEKLASSGFWIAERIRMQPRLCPMKLILPMLR